jgi:hypothetical protein
MIEIVSAKINDDDLWLKYFNLSREISRRHYPERYKPEDTVENFTKRRQDKAASDPTYEQYVILDNGNASAWLDISIWNNEFCIGFDTLYDEIPEYLLKEILTKAAQLINTKGFAEASYYTYRETIFAALKKAGAAVDEEYLISHLKRKDMDEGFYREIVQENPLEKWKLEYYTEIPVNILEQYVNFQSKCLVDMFLISPYPAKVHDINVEYVKTVMETHIKNGTLNPVYILFGSGEIAGLCSILIDPFRIESVSHIGTLTATAANHRGKGIARYLKAKMYLKLLEENMEFRYITSDTMPWNKYMYKINDEFGFKPYLNGCAFKITKEFLKNYLNLK